MTNTTPRTRSLTEQTLSIVARRTMVWATMALGITFAPGASAQGSNPAANQPAADSSESEAAPVAIFTDDGFRAVADALTGTWKTTASVDSPDGGVDIVVTMAPVYIPGLTDTMYSETARADEPDEPYDVAVHRFIRTGSGIRMRTHRLTTGVDNARRAFAGVFALPEGTPVVIDPGTLFPTLDYAVRETDTGFKGSTPFPYPTSNRGAIEVKGAFEVSGDRLVLSERGFDGDGQMVWGPEDEGTVFTRTDPIATHYQTEGGVHVVEYNTGEGDPIINGNFIVVHYDGYIPDGRMFDSSVQKGEAFRYRFPGRLITGWIEGMQQARVGSVRRLFIPSELAYGSRGAGNPLIGANQDIRFLIRTIAIEPGS